MIRFLGQRWFSSLQARSGILLLLLWIVIGSVLRFTQLTAKPPWTDEFATMVFSLGNDFNSVPLNQIISIEELLQPLQPNPDATIADVVSLLLHEDNHPPLYFVLAHLWMKLFPTREYVNLWVARSLPAFFGVVSIPAIYWLGKITFNSRLVGQLSAALIAVSPYGIFLAQEARHYTLAILFVIASFGCFLIAIKYFQNRNLLPIWLVFFWTSANVFGLSVHYFFALTLIAEVLALIFVVLHSQLHDLLSKNWQRLGIIMTGTTITSLIIIFITPDDYGNGMVDWIQSDKTTFLEMLSPIFQLFAAWITFFALLPVESSFLPIVIISGAFILLFFVWLFPKLQKGLKALLKRSKSSLLIKACLSFLAAIISQFLIITYFFKIDITRGARYNFTYFPIAIFLVGAILAFFWKQNNSSVNLWNLLTYKYKRLFIIVWLMGLVSALTVCYNLGYQKYYRPELLTSIIRQNDSVPFIIATTYESLVKTGELMGLAWELEQSVSHKEALFLLVEQPIKNNKQTTQILNQSLLQLSRPFDLWTINFYSSVELNNCQNDSDNLPSVNGYQYNFYHCL